MRARLAWVKELWDHMTRARTLGLAAETAFWIFLSLVPLAAAGALLAARFALHNSSVVSPALEALPGPARDLAWDELARVAKWNGGSVGPVAAIVFVWLASSGVHAVFDAFEVE